MMSPGPSPLLSTHALVARYGDFQALFGLDIEVAAGEIVALIGANGAGKSTFLKCLIGLLPSGPGMVRFDGEPISGLAPHRIVHRGIAMIPEGRRLFTGMSVEDNLRVAIDHARRLATGALGWTLPRVYELFPAIAERRSAAVESLSGGQQQMVAIGRALLCNPRLLLCDELSLGLAPGVIREVYAALPAIAAEGTALVLVEQDVSLAQRSSARLYCLLEGRVTLSGKSKAFDRAALTAAFFGAHHALA
jgi:branched-chain amino acid transport system ATP-binding protein